MPITRLPRIALVMLAAFSVLSVPALAGSADQIRARIAGFRQLGTSYKVVTDGLRAGDLAAIREASGQIVGASRSLYGWFPRGSGPRPGVKTAAKLEVWTRGAEFRAAADGFSRQAQTFQRVAAGGDMAAIRGEARRLGASCKGCHDSFRVPGD